MASFSSLPLEIKNNIIRIYVEDAIRPLCRCRQKPAHCAYRSRASIAPLAFTCNRILAEVTRLVVDMRRNSHRYVLCGRSKRCNRLALKSAEQFLTCIDDMGCRLIPGELDPTLCQCLYVVGYLTEVGKDDIVDLTEGEGWTNRNRVHGRYIVRDWHGLTVIRDA